MTDRELLLTIRADAENTIRRIDAHLMTPDVLNPGPIVPNPGTPGGDVQTGGMNVYFVSSYAGEVRTFTFTATGMKHLIAVNTHPGGVGTLGPIEVAVLHSDGAVMHDFGVLDPPMLNAWMGFQPNFQYAIRVKLISGGAVAIAVQG